MVEIESLKGDIVTLSDDDWTAFKSSLRGTIVMPSDTNYDDCREIWNKMIDKKPACIVQCSGPADVVACVQFASKHNAITSIRGGGHNIAGKSLKDNGMCIDLSTLRSVFVDPKTKTAIVSPGATIGDVDHETKEYGLALPMGINSTTGVAGLTLGGGFGWLSRKAGMTVDSLIGADVVTADGKIVHCSESENTDLLWALRGGGGNFGIVTKFIFKLQEIGPMVYAGPIIYPLEEGKEIFAKFTELAKDDVMSEELTPWLVLRQCPPFPFIDEQHHFKPVVVVAVCYAGKVEDGEAAVKPFLEMGTQLGNHVGPCPLSAWNQAFDGMLTAGMRNYWKTCNVPEHFSSGIIDVFCDAATKLPNFGSEVFICRVGGYTNKIGSDATAYAHRGVPYFVNCHTRWEKSSEDDINRKFACDLMTNLKPYTDGTQYQNFVSEGDEIESDTYGTNITKLTEIKKKYDPNNFFRVNYNISTTSGK